MAANEDGDAFPSWIYHLDHPAQLVKNAAEAAMLPDAPSWSYSPLVTRVIPPTGVNANVTDAALVQRPESTRTSTGVILVRHTPPADRVADPSNNHKAKKDR